MHNITARTILAAAAVLAGAAALPAAAQSTYERRCVTERSGSDIVTNCSATFTPAARPAPPPTPFIRGPGTQQDVVWRKPTAATAPEPAKSANNHCGPGFRMLPDFSCQPR